MSHAYGSAFSNPVRRVYDDVTVTSLLTAVALVIGLIELTQVSLPYWKVRRVQERRRD
jgi:high-affinity nickel-transport protein